MFVVGRVLDPQGKPVPGATVMASARAKFSGPATGLEDRAAAVIAHANADATGGFVLDAPRTSSSRDDECMAIALAPGYGAGWVHVDPDVDRPESDISLQPEQLVQGRLLDLTGRPVQGVVVSVAMIHRPLVADAGPPILGRFASEGPVFLWDHINDFPAWPKPATTDADGRFTVHGIGRGLDVRLVIIDPRFARQMIDVVTDDAPGAKVVSSSLQPAQIIIGRVTYADTGRAVPHARIAVTSTGEGQQGSRSNAFETDADGRFRANPCARRRVFRHRHTLPMASSTSRSAKRIDWPKGAIEQSLDLVLPRGIVIRGKVTDEGSGRPVASASVVFKPHRRAAAEATDQDSHAYTAADGSFELAAPTAAGHLAVLAPTEEYVLREIGNREFALGLPGGRPVYSHCFVACDPRPDGSALEVNVALRRGLTVVGRIIGPDEKPVREAWIIGRAALGRGASAWRAWQGYYHRNATNGRFELQGLDPEKALPTYFLDPMRRLGATAHLTGRSSAGGPITIRLEPCGRATARLVDPRGQPIAGYREEFLISMIISPGPSSTSRNPADAGLLANVGDLLVRIDPINYAKPPISDPQGRITFPALIPGATYRIADRTTIASASGTPRRKDFTVKPGETLDLGDILIEKPNTQ